MRQWYIVMYDISEPRRLNRVMETTRDFGDRIQLSVFLCQLSQKDLVVLSQVAGLWPFQAENFRGVRTAAPLK